MDRLPLGTRVTVADSTIPGTIVTVRATSNPHDGNSHPTFAYHVRFDGQDAGSQSVEYNESSVAPFDVPAIPPELMNGPRLKRGIAALVRAAVTDALAGYETFSVAAISPLEFHIRAHGGNGPRYFLVRVSERQ